MITRKRIRNADGTITNHDVDHGPGPIRDLHHEMFRGAMRDVTIQNVRRTTGFKDGIKAAEATIRASRGWDAVAGDID